MEAISAALFAFLRPPTGRTIVLADWTDIAPFQHLVFSLPRDLKNRNRGLGLDEVRLSTPERHDRQFCVLALAYMFLCAFGAAAETIGIARLLKANTRAERVMSLARIGNYFLQIARCPLETAFGALAALPT